MLGVQDHVPVHQPGRVRAGYRAGQHVEKVRSVRELGMRRHRLFASPESVMGGDDGGYLGGQPEPLAQACGLGLVSGVRVECLEQ